MTMSDQPTKPQAQPAVAVPPSLALYTLALITAHGAVDLGAGATPALVQVMRSQLTLAYTTIGILVTTSSLGGAICQTIFGLLADARRRPQTAPLGAAVVALGLTAAGFARDTLSAGLALGLVALGSALFHPEAVRTIHLLRGRKPATVMSYFSAGGSTGWALGPAVVALLTSRFGLAGMRWWLVPGLAIPLALFLVKQHSVASPSLRPRLHAVAIDRWGAYAMLFAVALLRGAAHLGVLIFFPAYLIDHAGMAQTSAVLALSVLLFGGVVTQPIIGRMADRYGRKPVLAGTIGVLAVLVALLPSMGGPALYVSLLLVGGSSLGALPVGLVMSQEYLPTRVALGGGLMVSASSIAALVATPLGMLADGAGVRLVIYVCAGLAGLGTLIAATLPTPLVGELTNPRQSRF